jgi:plastocyanin
MFMSRHNVAPATTLVLFLAAVFGCGGGDGNGGTPPPTTSIAKPPANSGDAQSGRVGEPLPNPLQVVVTEDGSPLSGATVAWSTPASGGSLNPTSSVTGSDGVASSTWSLGTVVGPQGAAATLSGASGSPVSFTATATVGAAAVLEEHDGNGQSGEINTELPEPLQARVSDEFGNPVGGVTVDWAATGATPSASSDETDASGISDVNVTLGATAGPITITASSPALEGSPVTFTATATEAAPIPTTASVTVRNNNFLSVRNGTSSPAVDTVSVGGTVTWTWAPTATNPHDVTSTGTPSFPGQETAVQPPPYSHTFTSAGTYNYLCTVHGTVMSGRVVVR